MHLSNHKTLSSFKALCCIDDNLILGKANALYIYDIENDSLSFILKLPYKRLYQNFSFSKSLRRLFRLDISYAYYSKTFAVLLVSVAGTIFEIDLPHGKIIGSFDLPRGSRVLNFAEVEALDGFDHGIYFGEYFNNDNFDPVSIYRRTAIGEWIPVYTFAESVTYHIHNLIVDPYRNCVWIFSGDLDEHSAIWKAENNFRTVSYLLKGNQQYRACVGLVLKDKLIYATDSNMEINTICEIVFDEHGSHTFQQVYEVEGSVIYGAPYHNYLLCSTTVESGDFNTSISWQDLVDTKPGKGNKSNYATVLLYDYENRKVVELARNRKDRLPFLLFQFGSMIFPTGMERSKYIIWSNVALVKNDCSTEIHEIERDGEYFTVPKSSI